MTRQRTNGTSGIRQLETKLVDSLGGFSLVSRDPLIAVTNPRWLDDTLAFW